MTIDLQLQIGNNLSSLKNCPCAISSPSPIISWTLPSGVLQSRYNIKVTPLEGTGLFINGSEYGSQTFFQYPTTNPMSYNFYGLCKLEVYISSNLDGDYEYYSGEKFFVFDNSLEIINGEYASFKWDNALDIDTQWNNLRYHLMVSSSIDFTNNVVLDVNNIYPSQKEITLYNTDYKFNKGIFFYWKVRAFDGLDYGEFSKTNAFMLTDNINPEISINSITVIEEKNKDVMIEVTLSDSYNDRLSLEVYYRGGNVGNTWVLASLTNSVTSVMPGTYNISWRSSLDEKKVSSSYQIRIIATDKGGLSGEDISDIFDLDNSLVGIDTGGDGSISNNYIITGWLATRTRFNTLNDFIVNGKILDIWTSMKIELFPVNCYINTWSIYRTGEINSFFRKDNRDDFIGYPDGMKIYQRSGTQGTDLNPLDQNFIWDNVHVDSLGRYREMSNQTSFKTVGADRFGLVKFCKKIAANSQLVCPTCNGTGWSGVVIDPSVPSGHKYKYKRVTCDRCDGNRFVSDLSNSNLLQNSIYSIPKYLPIDRFFYPLNKSMLTDDFPLKGMIDNPIKTDITNVPVSGQIVAAPEEIEMTTIESSKVIGEIVGDPIFIKEDESPIFGTIKTVKENYVPGMSYDDEFFMRNRETPTHRWEPGIFTIKGNLYKETLLEDFKIIFLQNEWSVYNTIHWSGPGSVNTMTQVQYCQIRENGSNGTFRDVIAENSIYHNDNGCWLVPAQVWHCKWDTSSQITRSDNNLYKLRIRQYNIISKTFSSWKYSETNFSIKEAAINPANIYYTEYMKFSKSLNIYFRLDDKDNDLFNIIAIYYKEGTQDWILIDNNDIDGNLCSLSSSPGEDGTGNKHLIVWNTISYNLTASNDYRLKIEVTKSKFINEFDMPLLKWKKTVNTVRDIQERIVERNMGFWQKFHIEDDGTITKLDNEVFIPGRIKELEDMIFKIKIENDPLPEGADGYYSFMEGYVLTRDNNFNPISVNITDSKLNTTAEVDGDNYNLIDWLSFKDDSGESRNNRIYVLQEEIQAYIEETNIARQAIENSRNYVRRNLIDQGYYCNGFKNNTPVYESLNSNYIDEDSKFLFKVLTYFPNNIAENGFYNSVFSEHLGAQIYSETTGDSTFTVHEYERTSEIFSRIQIDQMSSFKSVNGQPMRDILFNEDGERLVTSIGGENTLVNNKLETSYALHGEIETSNNANLDINISSESTVNPTSLNTFYIPENQLPGQAREVSLWGDTFDGAYSWRVSSYNLLYGVPIEQPFFSASASGESVINLSVTIKGDKDIVSAKITGLYFIEDFFASYSEEDSNSSCEISILTDPSLAEIESGCCSEFNWTPLTLKRHRPVVIKDNHNNYHLWYIKEASYQDNTGEVVENVVVYAKGKTPTKIGEYSMAVPVTNVRISDEISDRLSPSGANESASDIFGHTIALIDGTFIMYYLVRYLTFNKLFMKTSSDGYIWGNPTLISLDSRIYNPFVRIENNRIALYGCLFDGVDFLVNRYTSLDGINFNDGEVFFSSNNPISSFFIMEHNSEDVFFFTECINENETYVYNIKNSSNNSIFPTIENASNPFIIKEGFDYIVYFERDNKIFNTTWRNYTKKPAFESWNNGASVTGEIEYLSCSEDGIVHSLSFNRSSLYNCTKEILGWIVTGENNTTAKEYRIEGEFLSEDNISLANGEMYPSPFNYTKLMKELAYK
jgi:hypothetical protein